MQTEIKVRWLGSGGYGSNYVAGMLDAKDRSDVRLVAGSIRSRPLAPGSMNCSQWASRSIHRSMKCTRIISRIWWSIASPIHVHCNQTVTALQHGSHVLCEKPLWRNRRTD